MYLLNIYFNIFKWLHRDFNNDIARFITSG